MMWRFAEIKQLPDIVRYWASKKPGKIALIEANRTRTYAALDAISSKIANGLLASAIPPKSHIGFVGRNCIELFEIWFAAGKAGCALAPFNWRSSGEELRKLIEDAKPPIVFVSEEFLPVMQDVQNRSEEAFKIIEFDPTQHGGAALALWADEFVQRDPSVLLAEATLPCSLTHPEPQASRRACKVRMMRSTIRSSVVHWSRRWHGMMTISC